MRRFISSTLILVGTLLLTISIYEFCQHKINTQQALIEVKQRFDEKADVTVQLASKNREIHEAKGEFKPKENEVIGILFIPKIEAELPIIEGTEEEMLQRGVGHHTSTVFPGDGDQILLSGHRNTVFRKLGDLEAGDRFIIEMPYGTYEYEMRSYEIVDADNTDVIRPRGEEVLTLSTCYPFYFVGSAPDRYVIYAYPIEAI